MWEEQRKRFGKQHWFIITVIVFFIIITIRQFLFMPVVASCTSMSPTIRANNRMLVNKISYHVNGAERFDIILFQGENNHYIRRVIGLPGDNIEFIDGQLLINGVEYFEYFLTNRNVKTTPDFHIKDLLATNSNIVPDGHYFVLGDNRLHSIDSRSKGFISSENVIGLVRFIFWPLDEFKMV